MKLWKIMPVLLVAALLTSCGMAEASELLSPESRSTGAELCTMEAEETSRAAKTGKTAEKSVTRTAAAEPEGTVTTETSEPEPAANAVTGRGEQKAAQPETQNAAEGRENVKAEAEKSAHETTEQIQPKETERATEKATEEQKEAAQVIAETETTQKTAEKETETRTAHRHSWTEITETVHHDAVTEEVWVTDREAWDEVITREIPVTEEVLICVASCRGCGACFSSESVVTALKECQKHIINEHGNSCGYGTEQSYYETRQTGTEYETEVVHHEEEGHLETRTVSETWDEKVVTGYRCSGCGATKEK